VCVCVCVCVYKYDMYACIILSVVDQATGRPFDDT